MGLLTLQLQLITGGRIGGIKGMSPGSVAPSPSPQPAQLASLADFFALFSTKEPGPRLSGSYRARQHFPVVLCDRSMKAIEQYFPVVQSTYAVQAGSNFSLCG